MNNPVRSNCFSIKGGFTLLEVMVTLSLGALVLGDPMGLISVSLQYNQRLKDKSRIQPLLESAAQEILADPKKAMARSIPMGNGPDAPRVNIQLAKVELPESKGTAIRTGELYRRLLECRGQVLEFSLYVTRSDIEGADEPSVKTMSHQKGNCFRGRSNGFTLVELVLATLISSLVIGISR